MQHKVTDFFKCTSKCMLSSKLSPPQNVCGIIFPSVLGVLLLYRHRMLSWLITSSPTWLHSISSQPNFPSCCPWLWVQTVTWAWRMWRCRLFHESGACLIDVLYQVIISCAPESPIGAGLIVITPSYAHREAIFLLSSLLPYCCVTTSHPTPDHV